MIHFQEVDQFMNYDIVDNLFRRQGDTPIEIEIGIGGTAGPQAFLILDSDLLDAHAHFFAPMGDPFREFLQRFLAQDRFARRADLGGQTPRRTRGKYFRQIPA